MPREQMRPEVAAYLTQAQLVETHNHLIDLLWDTPWWRFIERRRLIRDIRARGEDLNNLRRPAAAPVTLADFHRSVEADYRAQMQFEDDDDDLI